MKKFYVTRNNKYHVRCYSINVTEEMKNSAYNFAKELIESDNQYTRLLPTTVRDLKGSDVKSKLEIQRTFIGKLGEIAFASLLKELGKDFDAHQMFTIYQGEDNVDSFDFCTKEKKTVDVKTGFRQIHKLLLVNEEQFNNNPKDYYVAVKLNAKDSEKQFTLVDLDSITEATILGYADYAYLKNKCRVKNFGEGDAVFLEYNKLMRIDLLLTKFA